MGILGEKNALFMHSASCECVFVENEFKYREGGEAVFQRAVIFHILTSGGGGEGEGGGAASGRGGD